MKKPNRNVMFAGLVLTALVSLKIYAATPKKPEPQVWTPGCVASVPRSWGTFRGASTQSGWHSRRGRHASVPYQHPLRRLPGRRTGNSPDRAES